MEVEDIICETMLKSYKELEALCNVVDNEVLRCGTDSYNADIFYVFDKITVLINEKIAYCNIKVIIEEAFARLKNSTELQYRYLLGYRVKEIEAKFGLEQTCVTNRIKRQKKKLFEKIKQRYDKDKLFDILSSSKLLLGRYNRELEKGNDNDI